MGLAVDFGVRGISSITDRAHDIEAATERSGGVRSLAFSTKISLESIMSFSPSNINCGAISDARLFSNAFYVRRAL